MKNATRNTEFNIGDCFYYKNTISNMHQCATYVAKVIGVTEYNIIVRMKPTIATMGETPYSQNIPRTYTSSIAKNLIGTDGVSVKLYDDFKIDDPEKEARLICEKNNVIFVKMIGEYGFQYYTKGADFTNIHYAGDTYEDDVRLFYMEAELNNSMIATAVA